MELSDSKRQRYIFLLGDSMRQYNITSSIIAVDIATRNRDISYTLKERHIRYTLGKYIVGVDASNEIRIGENIFLLDGSTPDIIEIRGDTIYFTLELSLFSEKLDYDYEFNRDEYREAERYLRDFVREIRLDIDIPINEIKIARIL